MSEKITICSVGDLMICDSPLYVSMGVGTKYKSIRKQLVREGIQRFKGADIVIGNFETVVHKPKFASLTELQMSCSAKVIADLKKMGVSILNLANNHCLQHGSDGFNATVDACLDNGIVPIGLLNHEPYTITIKGEELAFLSLCIHLEWNQPENVVYEYQIEKVINDIKNLRAQNSSVIIIVSVHWGDEFAMYPSNAQIALAHILVDLGANIILGHHSHVFQGIEYYKSAVIAYSQGNYISDMVPRMCRETGIVKVEIRDKTISCKMEPYYISDDYIPVKCDNRWFDDRVDKLKVAVSGQVDDDQYWRDISHNHAICHNCYKNYFKKNLFKYRFAISTRMIFDFFKRKWKRIVGTSTDGRISSMDNHILSIISTFDNKEK